MEASVSGVVSRQTIRRSNTRFSDFVNESRPLFGGRVGMKPKKKSSSDVLSCVFRDQGHLQYYCNSNYERIVSEKEETCAKKIVKMKKKQVKLVKGLRKDLLALSEMDFGLGADRTFLLDEAKSNMISEAANVLLEQLQKLKAEEKEMKKKMKDEKAKLKDESSSTSSESSESSDSDCGTVVDTKTLKHPQTNQIVPNHILQESVLHNPPLTPGNTNLVHTPSLVPMGDSSAKESVSSTRKIEVCMGGKCKKSGGAAILEEFQRVLGIEASVSGCKCMGKCKVGPNVKVSNGLDENSVRIPATSSLCIGVGLEDVGNIVASILGDDHNQIGVAGAT